jgi:uncharacterized protein DUF3108
LNLARPRTLAVLAVAGLAFAACTAEDDAYPSDKIFASAPWDGPERLTYDLKQKGDSDEASCVLSTALSGDETKLTRECQDENGNRDTGEVVVASDTLDPQSSSRTLYDADKDRTTVHKVTYQDLKATFETTSGGKTRSTTRDLPEPTEDDPNPGWYDDESLLWLVRGIKLEDGYKASYTHVINAGAPRVVSVDVSVHELETVKVPAGEFRAWRVRVSRDSVYTFWVEEAGEHRVVKAQIEDSTYELEKAE